MTKTTKSTTSTTTTTPNNGSILQPLLLGVIMVLLTMGVRHVKENMLTKRSGSSEEWLLSSLISSKSTYTINPLDAVQDELNRIQQYDGAGTRIFNSFVRSAQVLKQLADAKLWDECNQNGTKWWDGQGEPQNIWQELAIQIWNPLPEAKHAVGYEYWCNILTRTTGLEWHVDKDEVLYAEKEEVSNPIMGAVYYGHFHSVVGGYLELINADASMQENEFDGGRESIRPEYNRLVILNVSKWHRVGEIQNGQRYTFAVNIWKQKPLGL